MSITFKKSNLKRMPSESLRELYIAAFDELPSVGFNYDDEKLDNALIDALSSNTKVPEDADFDVKVPEGALE